MGNRIPYADLSAVEKLARIIRNTGPIRGMRVSSAQSGTDYCYWGTVPYYIRTRRDGLPIIEANDIAASERRSLRLAMHDAVCTAARENCVYLGTMRPGLVREPDAEQILDQMGLLHSAH